MSDEKEGLPEGWAVARVDEVGDVQLGRQRSPIHHSGPHMRPYLRVANVYENRIDTSDVMTMNFEPDEFEKYVLSVGDILLNEGQSKELVGRSAVYGGEVPGACFTNSLVRFRPGALATVEYSQSLFRHYLRDGTFQSIAKITTNIAHLGKLRFAALKFLLPPINEQRRIVAKIESLQARSAAAKEALDAIPPLLEKFRQSVLAAAFRGDLTAAWRAKNPDVEPASELLERIRAERRTRWIADAAEKGRGRAEARARKAGKPWTAADDAKVLDKERVKAAGKYTAPEPVDAEQEGLPELPEGWCWARLETVCKFIDYRGKTPQKCESGIPLITAKNVRWARVKDEPREYISETTYVAHMTRGFPRVGDVLITTEAPMGLATTVERQDRFGLAQRIINLQPFISLPGRYLMWWLLGPNFQRLLTNRSTGTTVSGIKASRLKQLPVALPPLSEQAQISNAVDRLIVAGDEVGAVVSIQSTKLASLNQSILAKAFRGELVPQDPTDEPAGVLLERIRAEREAAEAAKKASKKRRK